MESLKILFIGIGSIGTRHLQNLMKVLNDKNINYSIDAFREFIGNENMSLDNYLNKIYEKTDDVPDDYDIIFINNPTKIHIETLKRFNNKGQNFFIEKPICTLEELDSLELDFLDNEKLYYVASPLRYTKVINYIKENIDPKDVISIRAISSSYLPSWRPNVDYRETYSAQKALGGGVAIDLIHEWDYISYIFGLPKNVHKIYKQVSELEVDVEDVAIYIAEFEKMVAEVHLDYFGRVPIRKMEIFTNEDTIVADLIKSKVEYLKSEEVIGFGEERNEFQIQEIEYFINLVLNNVKGSEIIDNAIKILKIIKE